MKVRYYQEADYNYIVELASHIWEGHDYLPHMVNKYLRDSHSHPIVVEIDGVIAAFGNLRLLNESIAWLEAIRTHPNYRGRGFSKLITDKHIEIACDLNVDRLWLSTAKNNLITRNLLAKYGFHELFSTKLWRTDLPVSFLPTPENWQLCNSLSVVEATVQSLHHKVVLGEFKVLPLGSYEINNWLQQSELYCISKGVMSIRKSIEHDDLIIVGINTDDTQMLESGMNFALSIINQYSASSVKLFYPSHVTPASFSTDREFRIMEYKFGEIKRGYLFHAN